MGTRPTGKAARVRRPTRLQPHRPDQQAGKNATGTTGRPRPARAQQPGHQHRRL